MTMRTDTIRKGWRGLGLAAVGALLLTTCGTRVLTDAEPQSARIVSVCPTPGLSRVSGCDADRADADVRPTGIVAPDRDARAADPTTTLAPATTAPPVTEPPTTVPAPPETPAPAPAEAAPAEPAPEEPAPEVEPAPEPETPDTTRAAKKRTVTTPPPAPVEPAPAEPAPEETAAPAPVKVDTGVAGRVISLINAQRQAQGIGPLAASGALNAAAARHSKDQANTGVMTHTGSDGSSAGSRASAAGYGWRGIAENVAKGQGSADSAFNGWLNSPGHNKNMMNASYAHAGVAVAYGADGTPFWTLVLGAPA